MSAVTRPRGPLPGRVYWTRRLVLLVLALALVYGVGRLVGTGAGGQQPAARAVGAEAPTTPATRTPAAATPGTPTPTGATAGATADAQAGEPRTGNRPGAPVATTLAQPTGTCPSSDLVATPSVRGAAHGGQPVVFTISLTTRTSPACDWTISPRTLVVKVTSGAEDIWSTQQCPGAIGKQAVIMRNDHPVDVTVAWNGRRSDNGCTDVPQWAQPGYYHVVAAAFGSDPVDEQFPLLGAVTKTVTMSPTPTPTSTPTASATSGATSSPQARTTSRGTSSAGATRPGGSTPTSTATSRAGATPSAR